MPPPQQGDGAGGRAKGPPDGERGAAATAAVTTDFRPWSSISVSDTLGMSGADPPAAQARTGDEMTDVTTCVTHGGRLSSASPARRSRESTGWPSPTWCLRAGPSRRAGPGRGRRGARLGDWRRRVPGGGGRGSRSGGRRLGVRGPGVQRQRAAGRRARPPPPGLVLFAYLHLAAYPAVAEALLGRGVAAVAYETVQASTGALPLLTPMSEVAGRMAPRVGARFLERQPGGRSGRSTWSAEARWWSAEARWSANAAGWPPASPRRMPRNSVE